VREVRTPIYTRFCSRVALASLYGAVRGNARSGERHVTARAVTLVDVVSRAFKDSI
jgi:hypothetical protein